MKRILVLTLTLALALQGCKDARNTKLMGLWSAEFVVEKTSDPTIKPLKGFLRLFGNQKYQMHFENTAQSFDLTGTWKRTNERLTMSVSGIAYQNPSELDQQTYRYPIIPVPAIRNAFGKQFSLKLTDQESTLSSLTIQLGPLVGHQFFVKRKLDQG